MFRLRICVQLSWVPGLGLGRELITGSLTWAREIPLDASGCGVLYALGVENLEGCLMLPRNEG